VVAAKGVIPRQPVDDQGGSSFRKASVSRSIIWLAQIMRWGVDDGLGIAGRADVSRNFCDRVRADCPLMASEARVLRRPP